MLKVRFIYILLSLTLLLTGCREDSIIDSPVVEEGEIEIGEEVLFTTLLPDASSQTRIAKTEWQDEVNSYKPVNHHYTFKVEMYKEGEVYQSRSYYYPQRYTNVGASQINGYDGTLNYASNWYADGVQIPALCWQDNVNRWGFKAYSVCSDQIEADQDSQDKWLRQDKLVGHSYLPIWTGGENNGSGTDPDVMQYKTSKEWYAGNKAVMEAAGIMPESTEDYKKVPLYMKHQRSWITVILKAGEGVKREALKYETSSENIKMTINSYAAGATEPLAIELPWPREELIHYDADKNGEAADNVSTTRYDAIVEPHNYATKKDEEVIAKINLSNQNFSFYAGNDSRYLSNHSDDDRAAADNAYDLKPGKHLTIEVLLSRESRKILITAWIEDWTEVATTTICDDYGNDGDPIVIKNLEELKAFLTEPKKNKEGSTGIIQPIELNLEGSGDWEPNSYTLKATLNLAGCVLKTKHQLFKDMESSANLVNGTIEMQDGATVPYAIAQTNKGTIERVSVTTFSGDNTTAKATVAGMVGWNAGTIYQCSSTLPVYATEATTLTGKTSSDTFTGYIGGIAAVSQAFEDGSMAVIDRCTVNASVNGADNNIYGGGIVGHAKGRVTNNTYEYGVTVSQPADRYKNIFYAASELRAYGNAWPTTATNPISSTDDRNPNGYTKTKYDAVIDCQAELDMLMNNQSLYNLTGKNYRISKDFTVSSNTDNDTDWLHGTVSAEDYSSGANNVSFNLDGNDKTITLTGTKKVKTTTGKNLEDGNVSDGTATEYTTAPMLFNHVLGEIKNLNIYLDQPLVASPSEGTTEKDGVTTTTYNAADAIAPLAYAVYGENGKLTNINVTTRPNNDPDATTPDVFVQSSTPAGLVVWAYGGATIMNCKVNVPIRLWLPESMGDDAKHYAGGIVACAATASIVGCKYLGNSELSMTGAATSNSATRSSNYYYGGIVGGTSIKNSDHPNLQIADCSSWYIATRQVAGQSDQSSKGAIIASSCYANDDESHKSTNGMSSERVSEGNWWQVSAIGAHTWAAGLNEEKVIGKKNGVDPDYN